MFLSWKEFIGDLSIHYAIRGKVNFKKNSTLFLKVVSMSGDLPVVQFLEKLHAFFF